MIQFKETGLVIENVWSDLHKCQLLDRRLDEMRKYLMEKYYMDYFSVNAINPSKTHYVANMGHNLWHTFNWTGNVFAVCPFTPKHFVLPTGTNSLTYFNKNEVMTLRAYYIGEEKQGYSVAFSTEQGVTQFCFTFANNSHLDNMAKDVYINLIEYFKYLAPILMVPFLEYFSRYNTLEDGRELANLIKEYPIRY